MRLTALRRARAIRAESTESERALQVPRPGENSRMPAGPGLRALAPAVPTEPSSAQLSLFIITSDLETHKIE